MNLNFFSSDINIILFKLFYFIITPQNNSHAKTKRVSYQIKAHSKTNDISMMSLYCPVV